MVARWAGLALALAVVVLLPEPAAAARAYDAGTIRWDAVRTERGGRGLVVAFTGGSPELRPGEDCWSGYRADVTETAQQVSIRLVTVQTAEPGPPTNRGCTLVGYLRTLRVRLAGPLAGRRLVDAHAGEPRFAFDAKIRKARFLPHGWKLRYEGPARHDIGETVVWSQTWTPAVTVRPCGDAAPRIELTQGPADAVLFGPPAEPGTKVSRPRVGAHRGSMSRGISRNSLAVEWRDGPTGYRLEHTPACDTDRAPRKELLVRVANSVR